MHSSRHGEMVNRMKCAYLYELYSKRDCVVNITEASSLDVKAVGCAQCEVPNYKWDRHPSPIDISVTSNPVGCTATVAYGPKISASRLVQMLRPFMAEVQVGKVYVESTPKSRVLSDYVTCIVTRKNRLEAFRGRYCRHGQCKMCGLFINKVGWASGAIVARYLDDRRVYTDDSDNMYIDPLLADELHLSDHFPDLRFYRVDIIPEPLDGDILPGDPGWNGTFMERPLPDLPPEGAGKPKRGRWTLD